MSVSIDARCSTCRARYSADRGRTRTIRRRGRLSEGHGQRSRGDGARRLRVRGRPHMQTAARGGLLRTPFTSCEALDCAGVGSCHVLWSVCQDRLSVEEGLLAMRVIRFLVTIMAAVVLLSAPAYGATWTTQTTSGPAGRAGSALTSVSCVSKSSCMAVGVDDNGYNSSQTSLEDVGSFAESWNGSVWSVVPTGGSPAARTSLYAVACVSPVFCIAVGESHSSGGEILDNEGASRAERALVEVWNGLAWTVQRNPGAGLSASGLFGVSCTSSRFCIAIGEHGYHGLAEIWNGTRWRIQTTPTVAKYGTWPTGISCVAADWCTMVGGYNTVKRLEQAVGVPLAEHWNGRRWRKQHAPAYGLYFPELSSVSCVSRSFCLASGAHYLNQQGTPSPFAERWNGKRWTAARAQLPEYSSLNGVSCLSTIECLAVGQFDPSLFAGPEPTEPVVESWTGARWRRLTVPQAPAPPPVNGYFDTLDPSLFGISCLSDRCTAVGAQAHGSDSATLAQSDAGPPSAAHAAAVAGRSTRVRGVRAAFGHDAFRAGAEATKPSADINCRRDRPNAAPYFTRGCIRPAAMSGTEKAWRVS